MPSARGIRAGRAFVELFADEKKLVRGLRVVRPTACSQREERDQRSPFPVRNEAEENSPFLAPKGRKQVAGGVSPRKKAFPKEAPTSRPEGAGCGGALGFLLLARCPGAYAPG